MVYTLYRNIPHTSIYIIIYMAESGPHLQQSALLAASPSSPALHALARSPQRAGQETFACPYHAPPGKVRGRGNKKEGRRNT